MLLREIEVVLLASSLLATSLQVVAAGVDKESIFRGARYPASELDMKLSDIQKSWWQTYVKSPDAETSKAHPLITQAGMGVNLDYWGDDHISATGWIMNLNGFLSMSPEQRKRLVLETMELVTLSLFLDGALVDKKSGRPAKDHLQNRHIRLTVIINKVTEDDRKESIRLSLPSELGVGQAGYQDGEFVFSEPYYLNLQVQNGVAVSGDKNTFVIEHE